MKKSLLSILMLVFVMTVGFVAIGGLKTAKAATKINIVAAESFYGSLAKEIGGKYVEVTSIINNSYKNPHTFTDNKSDIKKLDNAKIIIYNGAGYDSWINSVISKNNKNRVVISAADLIRANEGNNPHIWYNPKTFPAIAKEVADEIIRFNPRSEKTVTKNLNHFLQKNENVYRKISRLEDKYSGTKVIATEPVLGYMAEELGLKIYGEDFQQKIMENKTPTQSEYNDFINLINNKTVKVLFYNNQVTNDLTKKVLDNAKKAGIQIVEVSETMPGSLTVNTWMEEELNKIEKALKAAYQQ